MRDGRAGLTSPQKPGAAAPKTARRQDAAAPAPAKSIKWFNVDADVNVPRHGGTFHLQAGKQISSADYDVNAILRAGGKLTEISPPQHWIDTQLAALDRHEAVNGHDPDMRATLASMGVPGLVDAPAEVPASSTPPAA